jgi:uncharacterized protein YaaN involved in tellurite resistance
MATNKPRKKKTTAKKAETTETVEAQDVENVTSAEAFEEFQEDTSNDNTQEVEATEVDADDIDQETIEVEEVDIDEGIEAEDEVGAEEDYDDEDLSGFVDDDVKAIYEKDYTDVPKYDTADEETKEDIDDLVAQIDVWDENTIIDFGQEALSVLDEVSQRIQQQAERDGIFKEEMKNIEEAVKDMNFAEAGERFSNFVKQKGMEAAKNNAPEIAAGTVAGALTLNPLVGFGVAGALKAFRTYRKKKKEEAAQGIHNDPEGIEDELRTSSVKLNRLKTALMEADKKIPLAIKDVNDLAKARREAFEEISLHIGAALHKLKLVANNELAQAKRDYDQNPSFSNQENLAMVTDAFNALDQKVTELYGTRTVFLTTTVQLGHLKREYSRAHTKVRSHLTQSIPQWRSLISQVAKTLELADISKAIEAADDFADKLIEHNMAIQNETTRQIENSSTRGTHDPEKLIEMTKSMTENLQALENHARTARQSEEKIRKELEEASQEMMQASVKYVKARTERALEDASKITGDAALEDNTSDDSPKARRKSKTSQSDFKDATEGKPLTAKEAAQKRARRRAAKKNGPNPS